jgi:hypothetical protein
MIRSVFLLVLLAIPAHGAPLKLFGRSRPAPAARAGLNLSALESATISAQNGVAAHRGGSYAFEGVGFSTVSADQALRNCCYYGQRQIVESAVVQGNRGWFACIRYR